MREQALYAKLENFKLFTPQAIFLGYVVFEDGTQVDESKIEAIKSWPIPATIRRSVSFMA